MTPEKQTAVLGGLVALVLILLAITCWSLVRMNQIDEQIRINQEGLVTTLEGLDEQIRINQLEAQIRMNQIDEKTCHSHLLVGFDGGGDLGMTHEVNCELLPAD